MKITVDIDCTPEEARAFLGLPDVKPMQDKLMQDAQSRLTDALHSMDPSEMLKQWLPGGLKNAQQFFDAFSRMGNAKDK